MKVVNGVLKEVSVDDIKLLNKNPKLFWNQASEKGPVTELGEDVFKNADIINMELPDTVKVIGKRAFLGCKRMKNIKIPGSVNYIEDRAFEDCDGLRSVKLPPLKRLGRRAFYECDNLRHLELANGTSNVLEECFAECDSLNDVILPRSLTNIPDGMFAGCDALNKIYIPEGLNRIGNHAFWGCRNLSWIDIPDSTLWVGDFAFFNCNNAGMYVPKGLQYVGSNTFGGVYRKYVYEDARGVVFSSRNTKGRDYINVYNADVLKSVFDDFTPTYFITPHTVDIRRYTEILRSANTHLPLGFIELVHENAACEEEVTHSDFKQYKRAEKLFVKAKEQGKVTQVQFLTFATILGLFAKDYKDEKGKTVSPSKEAANFLQEKLKDKSLDLAKVSLMLKDIKLTAYNPRAARFVMNESNFKSIVKEERLQNGFLASMLNNFIKIEKTLEKGEPLTVDKVKQYVVSHKQLENTKKLDARFKLFKTNTAFMQQEALDIARESLGVAANAIEKEIDKKFIKTHDPQNQTIGVLLEAVKKLPQQDRSYVAGNIISFESKSSKENEAIVFLGQDFALSDTLQNERMTSFILDYNTHHPEFALDLETYTNPRAFAKEVARGMVPSEVLVKYYETQQQTTHQAAPELVQSLGYAAGVNKKGGAKT